MTHEDLRKRAVRWLTNTRHCSVVLSEMVTGTYETPDAIGWCRGGSFSILIECKVSRSDFFRNADKVSCRVGKLMGHWRYFLVPRDLVTKDDMLKFPGYGLIYAGEHSTIVEVDAPQQVSDSAGEIIMLVSALRRVRTREFITLNIVDGTEPEEI